MKHYLLTFAIIALLSSCATQERCAGRYPPTITEVTKTVTVYRDTTIYVYIKGDTVHDTKTVYIDRGGLIQSDPSMLSTRFAWSTAYVKDSKLFHNLTQLDDSIASVIRNATRTEIQYVDRTNTVEVKRELTGWQWFQIWCGRILIASAVVLILVIIARLVLKI